MIRTVFGEIKARFCDKECYDSYRHNRKTQPYASSPVFKIDGHLMGIEEGSIKGDFCAYCGENQSPVIPPAPQ